MHIIVNDKKLIKIQLLQEKYYYVLRNLWNGLSFTGRFNAGKRTRRIVCLGRLICEMQNMDDTYNNIYVEKRCRIQRIASRSIWQ